MTRPELDRYLVRLEDDGFVKRTYTWCEEFIKEESDTISSTFQMIAVIVQAIEKEIESKMTQ